MTGEEFRSLYQLGERLTEPPVVTLRALDASGSPVMVHYLLGDREVQSASLLEAISNAPASVTDRFREIQEVDGLHVVVSAPIPNFSNFLDLLKEAPDEGPKPLEESAGSPGAYTQLFKMAPSGQDPESQTPQPREEEKGPVSPAASEDKAPGAYTMMFGRGKTPAEEPPPSSRVEEAPKPEPHPPSEAEKTQRPEPSPPSEASQTPATPATPVPGPTPADGAEPFPAEGSDEGPGSYTMLFGKGALEEEAPEPEPIPPQTPSERGFPKTSGIQAEGPLGQDAGPHEEASATDLLNQGGSSQEDTIQETPVFPSFPTIPTEASPEEGESSPPIPPSGGPDLPDPQEGQPEGSEAIPPLPTPGSGQEREPGAYTQMFGSRGKEIQPPGSSPPYQAPVSAPQPPPTPPAASPPGPDSPHWERWKDTAGAAGEHIPSDDYLQRLSDPSAPGSGPSPEREGQSTDAAAKLPMPEPVFPSQENLRTGPGHYTMVREGLITDPSRPPPFKPKPPPEPSQAGAAATQASAPSRKTVILTVVSLVVVIAVAAALVVYFALTN